MSTSQQNRRTFLQKSAGLAAAGAVAPYWFTAADTTAEEPASKADRLRFGTIGLGGRGSGIAEQAAHFGDVVAVCDVDSIHAERGNRDSIGGGKADVYGDYRRVLDRQDIHAVTIGTPDHWHTKIAIEAMQSGKDVYCEKPVTLTIDEGKQLCQVAKETKRVFQAGTQQRTENGRRFLLAIALVRAGRIGKLQHVEASVGSGHNGEGPFPITTPPDHLDYDMWLGQAPKVPYIKERTHFNFRWWYDYSGGQITDWGVHHTDISQWAMGLDESGPLTVQVTSATVPNVKNAYETAYKYQIDYTFPNDLKYVLKSDGRNGIMLTGDKGRIFVNRGSIEGRPVEELKENPLPEDAIRNVYRGAEPKSHMGNFVDCIRSRKLPISDIFTHHRTLSTCHLANIAIHTGRKLTWDPDSQQIVGDDEANAQLKREQRKGYEIVV